MTEQQKEAVIDLAIGKITEDAFLKFFATPPVQTDHLVHQLLEVAFTEKDADEVECALIVGFVFGFSSNHFHILCSLLDANWHCGHEDIVSALAKLKSPNAIDALFRAATTRHEYLAYNDSRALASKAVFALSDIGTPAAIESLRLLANGDDPVVAKMASEQLAS